MKLRENTGWIGNEEDTEQADSEDIQDVVNSDKHVLWKPENNQLHMHLEKVKK